MPTFNFETFPALETDRLQLRAITADDAQAWYDLHQHPEVMRYLTDFESDVSHAEIQEIIEWVGNAFNSKFGMRWAITLKPDDLMIGSCGFHDYKPSHRSAEIGYELHHDYWRKGIMTEAIAELLRFCFNDLNLHRVSANVTVGNEASAGLLKSLGFTQEGTWRDCVFWRGAFHSLWQFGLLEDEYRQ